MRQSKYKVIFTALFQECGKETAWYLFMMSAAALLGPAQLLFKGRILDAAVSGEGNLLWEMLCFGAAASLAFLTGYGSEMGRQRMKRRMYGRFSARMLDKFSRIRYGAYESEETMDVIRRMGDAPQEHILGFFSAFLAVVSEIVSAFCYGIIFASLSFWCLVLGAAAFAAMLFFDFRRIRLMTELYEEQTMEERLMDSYGQILGSKTTLYDLRVAGAVPYLLKKRKEISDRIVKERYRRTIRSQMAYAYGEMTIAVWMGIVLFFSVYALVKGTLTIGLFVAVAGALHKGLSDGLAGKLGQPLGNLSPEGMELSGGQWQRLALSRACYRDSEVLVLDEPTAALDPVAENELYGNFVEMMEGRSCILISHRLAVARYTDRILVLQKGELIEEGNHDSLMQKDGVYASMYQAQSHWYAQT